MNTQELESSAAQRVISYFLWNVRQQRRQTLNIRGSPQSGKSQLLKQIYASLLALNVQVHYFHAQIISDQQALHSLLQSLAPKMLFSNTQCILIDDVDLLPLPSRTRLLSYQFLVSTSQISFKSSLQIYTLTPPPLQNFSFISRQENEIPFSSHFSKNQRLILLVAAALRFVPITKDDVVFGVGRGAVTSASKPSSYSIDRLCKCVQMMNEALKTEEFEVFEEIQKLIGGVIQMRSGRVVFKGTEQLFTELKQEFGVNWTF
ncbi:P-loop_containing nucleoside triphosphate hydrolase [Hexamita inflata]|uniref:P-loop containing nucleoside triphosphate hydrolase n=1 Tax=Hexamita inflata TaxID=28002 RepID=A0AA86PZ81_9EUKA|nr:P-loop containing nucleoside triphosphate hydrolase [Hexamita inflata]